MQNNIGYEIVLTNDCRVLAGPMDKYAHYNGDLIIGPDEHTETIFKQNLIRFISPVRDRKYFFAGGDSKGLLTTLRHDEFAEIVGNEMTRVKNYVINHIDEAQYSTIVGIYQSIWIQKVQSALQFTITNNRLWGTYIKDEATGSYTGIPVNFSISPEQFIKKFWQNSNEDLLAWQRFKHIAVLFQGKMPKLLSRQFRYTEPMNYICNLVFLCANPNLLIENPIEWQKTKSKRIDLMYNVNISGFDVYRNKNGFVSIKGFSMANLNEEYLKFLAIGSRYSDLY